MVAGAFSHLRPCRVMVVGDVMLDTYTIGKMKRISPEAPVGVLTVQRQEERPGGAGNVALSLLALGCSVTLLGRVGGDSAGSRLCSLLAKEGVDVTALLEQEGFPTTVKNRLIADNQQIVRIDIEEPVPLPESEKARILHHFFAALPTVDVVAISDYAKGFLTRPLLREIIDKATEANKIVVVDPKGADFSKYRGATLIKPNEGEARAAAALPDDAPLDLVAARNLKDAGAKALMVTRSAKGIALFIPEHPQQDFPAIVHEVRDVTGAGDTVLATTACALASGLSLPQTAKLCNLAASVAIARFGCARVTLSDLAAALLQQSIVHKVLDEEHLSPLRAALQSTTSALITATTPNPTAIFHAAKTLKAQNFHITIVHLPTPHQDPQILQMLASFHDIDFILLSPPHNLPTTATFHLSPEGLIAREGAALPKIQCR